MKKIISSYITYTSRYILLSILLCFIWELIYHHGIRLSYMTATIVYITLSGIISVIICILVDPRLRKLRKERRKTHGRNNNIK